jgi:hypothetical protein
MVTNLTAQPLGNGAILLAWDSDAAPPATFRVFRDGVLLATTRLRQMVLTVLSGEAPLLEVLDDPDATPAPGYPGYVLLAWYAPAGGALQYRVQEFVASAWVTRKTIDDQGQGYFTWASRILEDGQTHQFRVVPVGAAGNDGAVVSLDALMVRRPDPPATRFTYSSATAAVTISAM